jgi:nitrate reductase NapAB chaperone NapD
VSLHASDEVYRSLFALRICEQASIESETGKLWVLIEDRKREIPIEHIDELEQRGWVVLQGVDEARITEQGLYWLNRWGTRIAKQGARS